MTYAAQTSVPVERSKTDIERTLERYGATAFAYAVAENGAQIMFLAHGRQIRFKLPLQPRNDFREGPAGQRAFEQFNRSRWRALCLAMKAKLECVESGIGTFEDEFLAYIVLPGSETVGEWLEPQIAQIYESGKLPMLLEWGAK